MSLATANTNELQDKKEVFETMPVMKALATLAVPTILSQIIVIIYNLADAFYIGRTGNTFMVAAISLSAPLFYCINMVSNLFGIGGGSHISRLLGVSRFQEAKKVSGYCVWVAVAVALLYLSIVYFLMEPLLYLLGASADTVTFCKQYITWVAVIGCVPIVLSLVLANLLRSVGYAKLAALGIGAGGVLNIALDPLFMFVILSEGQEVLGAGIATCLSNVLVSIFFVIVFIRAQRTTALSFKFSIPEKDSLKKIYAIGIPSALGAFLANLSNAVTFSLTSLYGDTPVAALGIVRKLDSIPLNIASGLCQGMMPLIAYNYASKNYKRMKAVGNAARLLAILFALVCLFVYIVFRVQLVSLFMNVDGSQAQNSAETIAQGAEFLWIVTLAVPCLIFNFLLSFTFQAMGKGKEALFLVCCRQGIIHIPCLFILNHFFGLYGVIWAQLVSDGLTLILSVIAYFNVHKKLDVEISATEALPQIS